MSLEQSRVQGTVETREQVHVAFRLAVREGLDRTGRTQKAVAEAVGKSQVDISRYLSDPKRLPREWRLVEGVLDSAGADTGRFARDHGAFWGVTLTPDAPAPDTQDDEPLDDREADGPKLSEPLGLDASHEAGEEGSWRDIDEVDPATGAPYPDEADPHASPEPVEPDRPSASGLQPTDGPLRALARRLEPIRITPTQVALVVLLVIAVGLAATVAVLAHRLSNLDPDPSPQPATPSAPLATWTATVGAVQSPGLALRTAPSRSASRVVAQLATGSSLAVECGQVGEPVTSPTGQTATTWLRTAAGLYVTDIYVQVAGPVAIPNCLPGQPPLTLPS